MYAVMKILCGAIFMLLIATGSVSAQNHCAGNAVERQDEDRAGLTLGVDYFSNYLMRGMEMFGGDGGLVPFVSWSAFKTGLTVGVMAEIAQSYLWEGFKKKPTGYSVMTDDSYMMIMVTKKSLQYNHTAFVWQSIMPMIDYSYTIKNAVTLNANACYMWYYNSGQSTELARKIVVAIPTTMVMPMVTLPLGGVWRYIDYSFLTATVGVGLDFIPYLNPKVSVTHDYYTGLNKAGDFYVQLSLSHGFELTKEVKLTLAGTASYYYNRTNKSTNYYYYFDGVTLSPRWSKTRLRKGVSDLTPNIVLSFSKNGFTLKAGFFWCIVPAESFYKSQCQSNSHVNGHSMKSTPYRYYANLGASFSV